MVKNILIILILIFTLNFEVAIGQEKVGKEAPPFSLPDLSNEYIALRDLCGEKLRKPWKNKTKHVVVMSFFATWCKPCIAEIPHLQRLQKKYENKPVKFFLVNVGEEKEKIQKFLKSQNTSVPILMDKYKKISEKYDALTLPRLFIIDKLGIIQLEQKGFKDGEKFESDLDQILSKLVDS
jgi:thiol-disulfide isomerase/thioredoxin